MSIAKSRTCRTGNKYSCSLLMKPAKYIPYYLYQLNINACKCSSEVSSVYAKTEAITRRRCINSCYGYTPEAAMRQWLMSCSLARFQIK